MAKKYHVTLTELEREQLRTIIKKRNASSVIVKRAYVLLAADGSPEGEKRTDEDIVRLYGVSVRTVEHLRRRFVEEGFEICLKGKKRTVYKDKVFDGRVEAELIALRCGAAPEGYNRWTLRLLANKMVELSYVESISHESVRQILKKTNLSPGK